MTEQEALESVIFENQKDWLEFKKATNKMVNFIMGQCLKNNKTLDIKLLHEIIITKLLNGFKNE